jgi:RNA polymerase sigma-70 factor (ECF subfamily)
MADSQRFVQKAVRLTLERRVELLAYGRSIVGDDGLAEDILQEALVVSIRKGPELADGEDFGRWIREVVRRIALDHLKKLRRNPRVMDPEILACMESAWDQLENRWGADRRDALRHCLEKLSEKARQMVSERYERNFTGARLAERLGLTVKSAYATLTRIHRTLEACVRSSFGREEMA